MSGVSIQIVYLPENFDGRKCPDCGGAGYQWAGISTTVREGCRTCRTSGYVRLMPCYLAPRPSSEEGQTR